MYCFSLCCISNNSGVDGRQQERECVCVSDSGAQRRNIWGFIYSAACCSFSLRYGELGQSRVKISASIEDDDFSPGVSLWLYREGNIPAIFCGKFFSPWAYFSPHSSDFFTSAVHCSWIREVDTPASTSFSCVGPACCNLWHATLLFRRCVLTSSAFSLFNYRAAVDMFHLLPGIVVGSLVAGPTDSTWPGFASVWTLNTDFWKSDFIVSWLVFLNSCYKCDCQSVAHKQLFVIYRPAQNDVSANYLI